MPKFLAIGDSHIPRRAKDVAPELLERIRIITNVALFENTFFTGDLLDAPDFLNFLNLRTKGRVFIVIGNMDIYGGNRDAPPMAELSIKLKDGSNLVIGLIHGFQVNPRGDHDQLEEIALENGFHILISGHTHKEEIFLTQKGVLLLNPGSVTGAWSFLATQIPSFLTFNIKNTNITISLHQLDIRSKQVSEKKEYFSFKNDKISRKY